MFLRFEWLHVFVDMMPAGPGKEAWRALAEKYQVPPLQRSLFVCLLCCLTKRSIWCHRESTRFCY